MKPDYRQQINRRIAALVQRLMGARPSPVTPARASAGLACQGCGLASREGPSRIRCALPAQASYATVRGQMHPPQPHLSGSRLSEQKKLPRLRPPGQVSRRDLLGMCVAAGSLALGASAGVLGFVGIARDLRSTRPQTGVPKKGAIGLTSQARNSATTFANPHGGQQSLLIHLPDGRFVAYEQACTHRGVYVDYDPGTGRLVCPAHGAVFDPAQAGKVLQGPATTPLPVVPLQVHPDGTIGVG